MKILLANGTELEPLFIRGESRTIQGMLRDVLHFVFDDSHSLDEMDRIFTEEACETITVTDDDGNAFLHKGYTIRHELKKTTEDGSGRAAHGGTDDAGSETQKRIIISMAQRTYLESQLAKTAQESLETQLAVAELAEIVTGGV